MFKWFKKVKVSKYSDILLQGFPKTLEQEVKSVLSILPIDNHNTKHTEGQTIFVENLVTATNFNVILENEVLTIPDRIYFNEPSLEAEKTLSPIQNKILNCIYLRHHDGYVRQKRLENLINATEYWVVPYSVQLLGEYVFEILEVLDKHINEQNIKNYVKFIQENPIYWQKTESRIISYWNEYYRKRRFPKLETYLGKQIADRIKSVT